MGKFINHDHWNQYSHRETRRTEEDWDNYWLHLSSTVGKACDKWLESRGIVSRQFAESKRYNEEQKAS